MEFEYYYGADAEQFNFFRLPKKLIQDKRFKISSDAKILYGVLLDRMSLSMKNGWVDSENRVYIIYTVKDVAEEFNCSERKAIMLLSELDTSKGIGLIEKKRQGLGKPNIIYVKNFNLMDEAIDEPEEQVTYPVMDEVVGTIGLAEEKGQDVPQISGIVQPVQTCKNLQVQKCKNLQIQKCKDMQVQKCKDMQVKNRKNMHPSNTDNSNTNYNNLSINPAVDTGESMPSDGWTDRGLVLETFKKKLKYDILCADYPYGKQRIDELFYLLTDACCDTGDTLVVGRNSIPIRDIRIRFMQQLKMEHIRYVLYCMDQNTTKIKNIRAYLLAALYNAPVTMTAFYRAEVVNDMVT